MFLRIGKNGKPIFSKYIYFDDAPGEDGDEDEGGGGGAPRKSPIVTAAKYGNDVSAMAAHIDDVERDNYKLRNKQRSLREEVEALTKKLPGEESRVLIGDDAKVWDSIKVIAKPEEIISRLKELDTLRLEVTVAKKDSLLRDIATDLRFDFQVLKDLDSRVSEISYEQKEILRDDGTKAKVWISKFKEGEILKELEVSEFYKVTFPKYMVALSTTQDTKLAGLGVSFPEQPAIGNSSGGNLNPGSGVLKSRYGYMAPKEPAQ